MKLMSVRSCIEGAEPRTVDNSADERRDTAGGASEALTTALAVLCDGSSGGRGLGGWYGAGRRRSSYAALWNL